MVESTLARPGRRVVAVVAAFALALGGVLLAAPPAHAASFPVTNLLDDGSPGSLRDAISQANASAGPDTVEITVAGTIMLTGAPIVITDGVVITGPGKDQLTIERDASFDMFRVEMDAGVPQADRIVGLGGVTLDGGDGATTGYGLLFHESSNEAESLTITDSRLVGFDGDGRALTVQGLAGAVTISDASEFLDNNFTDDWGGAIEVDDAGDLTISDTTFEGNSSQYAGGGFFVNDTPTAEIIRSVFVDNHSLDNRGGAFAPDGDIEVSVIDSEFINNTAHVQGGAIGSLNLSSLGIQGSLFDGNESDSGGAIFVDDLDANESIAIIESRFIGNSAVFGSGGVLEVLNIAEDGELNILNSEFVDNSASIDGDSYGGAIFIEDLYGSTNTYNSTFSSNSADYGAALSIDSTHADSGVAIVQSTIQEEQSAIDIIQAGDDSEGGLYLFHSTIEGDPAVRIGSFDGSGVISHTILTGTSAIGHIEIDGGAPIGAQWSVFSHTHDPLDITDGPGNQFNVDPMLAPLADNGGLTQTRLLLDGSPALDRGDPNGPLLGLVTDQRGAGFPRIENDRVDVGAVEMPVVLPATGSEVPAWLPAAGAVTLLLGFISAGLAAFGRRRITTSR